MSHLHDTPVVGALIGAAVAAAFVVAVTALAGSDTEIWWWPAVLAAGGLGGAVIGALFGAEAEGEPADEGYAGPPQSDT
jgi:hypothetical protein